MQYTTLGNTGLLVSRLSLGTMTFGGGEDCPRSSATSSTRRELTNWLRHRSTVASISSIRQTSTRRVKVRRLSGNRSRISNIARKDVVLATKVYSRVGPGRNDVGASWTHYGCR